VRAAPHPIPKARVKKRTFVAAVLLAAALLLALSASGCVKRDVAIETSPLTDNLAAYWTCAVAYRSDGHGADANEGFTFVPWFESRVRERGVFDPLARDEGAESEVTLRLDASQDDEHVSLHVTIIDTRTHASLGEVEAVSVIDAAADAGAGDASESRRVLALRSAAERILDMLQARRHASMAKVRRAPAIAQAPLPDGPPVGAAAVCSTQCLVPASTSSSHEEQYRVSAGLNGTMKELRECLDRVGAQLVVPAVLLRFSPDGRLRHMRVDVGGFEQLDCIQQVRARPPRNVTTTRASLLRCEYRCTVS
jgi:hypothetical protein